MLNCIICSRVFSRSDALTRHMKLHERTHKGRKRSCNECRRSKIQCSGDRVQCTACTRRFLLCTYPRPLPDSTVSGRSEHKSLPTTDPVPSQPPDDPVEPTVRSSETNPLSAQGSIITTHLIEPGESVMKLQDTPHSPVPSDAMNDPSPSDEFFETVGESILDWMFPNNVNDNFVGTARLYSKFGRDNHKILRPKFQSTGTSQEPAAKHYSQYHPGNQWPTGWVVSPGRRFEFPPAVQVPRTHTEEDHSFI